MGLSSDIVQDLPISTDLTHQSASPYLIHQQERTLLLKWGSCPYKQGLNSTNTTFQSALNVPVFFFFLDFSLQLLEEPIPSPSSSSFSRCFLCRRSHSVPQRERFPHLSPPQSAPASSSCSSYSGMSLYRPDPGPPAVQVRWWSCSLPLSLPRHPLYLHVCAASSSSSSWPGSHTPLFHDFLFPSLLCPFFSFLSWASSPREGPGSLQGVCLQPWGSAFPGGLPSAKPSSGQSTPAWWESWSPCWWCYSLPGQRSQPLHPQENLPDDCFALKFKNKNKE